MSKGDEALELRVVNLLHHSTLTAAPCNAHALPRSRYYRPASADFHCAASQYRGFATLPRACRGTTPYSETETERGTKRDAARVDVPEAKRMAIGHFFNRLFDFTVTWLLSVIHIGCSYIYFTLARRATAFRSSC